MTRSILLKGLCSSPIDFRIQGVLKAPTDRASHNVDWIIFQQVNRLSLGGGGSIDGQGPSAWPYNQCRKYISCKPLAVSVKFAFVNYSSIQHLISINNKLFHFDIFKSNNIDISHMHLNAPGDGPNTDGIHIAKSTNVQVSYSEIRTGDDCISIKEGSKNVNISNVYCGPGHGIIVESLGNVYDKRDFSADVIGLTVRNCTFKGTDNGVKIKTWAPSISNIASDFTFEDIIVDGVS